MRRLRNVVRRSGTGVVLPSIALLLLACSPAAPASPTAAPAKPALSKAEGPAESKLAATTAPAKPTEAPAAKPAAAAKPAEVAKPAEAKPAPSPAAKPAASPAAKASFDEKAVANFYRGKTVRFVVGFGPGGSFDLGARLLARYMPKYLPGNPNIIVENKPGAGSLLAGNVVFNNEPKDGSVAVVINENVALQQALGRPGIEFDAGRITWVGASIKTAIGCYVRTDTGITSIQDIMGLDGKEVVTATVGPGTGGHDTPSVMNVALGTKFKIVSGYSDLTKAKLAVESNEAQALCPLSDTLGLVAGPLLDSGQAKVIVVAGSETPNFPYLHGVPPAESLSRTDEARQMLRAVHGPSLMARPLAVAPEVPADRVAALKQAFAQAFADAQLQADAEKAGVGMVHVSGDEVTRTVRDVLNTPPAVVAKLKDILK